MHLNEFVLIYTLFSVLSLCKELGWEEELRALNESTKIPPRTGHQIQTNDNNATASSSTTAQSKEADRSASPIINVDDL